MCILSIKFVNYNSVNREMGAQAHVNTSRPSSGDKLESNRYKPPNYKSFKTEMSSRALLHDLRRPNVSKPEVVR